MVRPEWRQSERKYDRPGKGTEKYGDCDLTSQDLEAVHAQKNQEGGGEVAPSQGRDACHSWYYGAAEINIQTAVEEVHY